MWNITKTVKKGDYLYGVCKEHPNSSKHGYVLLHRLIMENSLGRLLIESEIVHHVNGDKFDNNVDNLEVMSKSDHARLHMSTGRSITKLICPNCGNSFDKYTNQIKKGSLPKCSMRCNGQYSRKIQLGLLEQT